MAASATDHKELSALTGEFEALTAERQRLELSWLETAALLEG